VCVYQCVFQASVCRDLGGAVEGMKPTMGSHTSNWTTTADLKTHAHTQPQSRMNPYTRLSSNYMHVYHMSFPYLFSTMSTTEPSGLMKAENSRAVSSLADTPTLRDPSGRNLLWTTEDT